MKIAVAGSTGMVGRSLIATLKELGYRVIGFATKEVDLTNREKTLAYLHSIKPDVLIDSAAMVGGIKANEQFPVEFLMNNNRIQCNLMEACHENDVKTFLFLGSSCIYPRDAQQPLSEEYLMTGKLEKSHSAYAIAKLSGIELVNAYRREYGHKWFSVLPSNLYGPYDNFNLQKSHVIPALIRKIHMAIENKETSILLWGTGRAMREFLFIDDFAKTIPILLDRDFNESIINIGTGVDLPIAELAEIISNLMNFKGKIMWDKESSDGTPRKVLEISKIRSLGWQPQFSLKQGLEKTIEWYLTNLENGNVRV